MRFLALMADLTSLHTFCLIGGGAGVESHRLSLQADAGVDPAAEGRGLCGI
jgi:hypothetical protein